MLENAPFTKQGSERYGRFFLRTLRKRMRANRSNVMKTMKISNLARATRIRALRLVRCAWAPKCNHEFALSDLHKTGIEPTPAPKTRGYEEWQEYFRLWNNEPAHSERVEWKCCKCGEIFRAHCGLDILKHGKIHSPNSKISGCEPTDNTQH